MTPCEHFRFTFERQCRENHTFQIFGKAKVLLAVIRLISDYKDYAVGIDEISKSIKLRDFD